MRVSAKTDYALRALVEIGRRDGGEVPVAADDVAEAQNIPRGFLLGILAHLRRGGLLRSQRGPQGGWLLARVPGEITLADVVRIVDGPLASVHGMRPEAAEYGEGMEALQQVWIAVRASLREVLETLTLAHLLAGRCPLRSPRASTTRKPGDRTDAGRAQRPAHASSVGRNPSFRSASP